MKPIPNFIDYFATLDGQIWSSLQGGRWLSFGNNGHGYATVGLWKDEKRYTMTVHRLILETFVGPRPDGMEACHYNGVRTDNRLENLRWDTPSNNQKDRLQYGTDNCRKVFSIK